MLASQLVGRLCRRIETPGRQAPRRPRRPETPETPREERNGNPYSVASPLCFAWRGSVRASPNPISLPPSRIPVHTHGRTVRTHSENVFVSSQHARYQYPKPVPPLRRDMSRPCNLPVRPLPLVVLRRRVLCFSAYFKGPQRVGGGRGSRRLSVRGPKLSESLRI